MYQARYYKADGSPGSEVSLPASLFDGVVNENALHQVIKAYRANQRQGTASAKSRGQVAGGSRKPWRQKGTGRARQGTIRAVQWAGGGVAFPPQPHSWNQKVPRKLKALARRSALNDRAEAGRVVVIESLDPDAPKTRWLTSLLNSMETEGKVLVLTDGVKKNVHLSGRNLQDVQVLPFGTESPYDVIWSGTVVIEAQALDSVPDAGSTGSRDRRRPVDPEALAEEAAEQAARQAARKRAPSSRRVRGDEIDTSAPLVDVADTGQAPEAKAPAAKARKTAAPEPEEASPVAEPEVQDEGPSEEAVAEAAAPEAPAAEDAAADDSAEEEEATSVEAAADDDGDDFDPETVDLPNVADLAEFVAGIDNVAHLEALQARDSRKTAAPIYAARIEELS